MNKKNILLVLGLASALLVAGCGDKDTPASTDVDKAAKEAAEKAKEALEAKDAEINSLKGQLKTETEKPGQTPSTTEPGAISDADILAKNPWAFTYQEMCGIADAARTAMAADLKTAIQKIKANRDLIDKIAGYTKGATSITPSLDEISNLAKNKIKLKEIYDNQSKSGWSSNKTEIVKDKGITYYAVESAFYKEILKVFSNASVTETGYGIPAMVAYDLCWYFSKVMIPDHLYDAAAKKVTAAKVAAFVTAADDDKLPKLALIIKQLAALGKNLYSEADVDGPAAPIFDKDGKLSSGWDVNNADDVAKAFAYLEAKAIAYLGIDTGSTKFGNLSVDILKDSKYGDFKTEIGKFTAKENTPVYEIKDAVAETQYLLSRYCDVLDLVSLGQDEKNSGTFTATAGVTIDHSLMFKHASQTPRMRLAAYEELAPDATSKAWKTENQIILFPANGYQTKDFLKVYFGRRRKDVKTIVETKDVLFTHEADTVEL